MEQVDVIILGAGAAGLFAGIEAAKRGRKTLVVDHARAPGEKIRISGGGRCNFTNLEIGVEKYLSGNPRFALSALKRYTQWDFIARMDRWGIAWHEKTLGQLFCDGPATQVVQALVRDLSHAGGQLRLGVQIGEVIHRDGRFIIETPQGPISAAAAVVATGGKSIPKMGASGLAYRIASQFGLGVTETRPALVPLTFAEQELEWIKPLAGVALDVRVSTDRRSFDEAMLFTHRGISGPAILQISSYWREGEAIRLDLTRHRDLQEVLKAARNTSPRAALRTGLAAAVPERLARHLEDRFAPGATMGQVSNQQMAELMKQLQSWSLTPVGSEGYRTAEVTLGGIDTNDLDGRTMQARNVPGLYFVGEAVDVTGWLGGYNFQWAWSSGWAAGQVA